MSLNPNIRYGGLLFQGLEGDGYGFHIAPDGIEGWHETAESRLSDTPIPGQHGSFDVPPLLSSRLVTITGWCAAKSEEQLGWYIDSLTGQVGKDAARQFVAEEFGRTLNALAYAVRVKPLPWGGQAYTTYTIDFWMPDPRKFGDPRDVEDGKAAANYGSFPATPIFTVGGDRPAGYTINGPGGKHYTVSKAVTAGHPHTIDMADGDLIVDGALVDGAVTVGDTWAIPGGDQWAHTITGGTGAFTTTLRDTF